MVISPFNSLTIIIRDFGTPEQDKLPPGKSLVFALPSFTMPSIASGFFLRRFPHVPALCPSRSGAGIVDTIMEWGSNDEPAYMVVFKKGLPWDRTATYHKASPTYSLHKIRTPTLIHVGGSDERCPP